MNVLLIYPESPATFFSFKHALKFISKKAVEPPLGLLTVSAMLPKHWQKKLVDLNVTSLDTDDFNWADYIFISAMIIQKDSVREIVKQAKSYNVRIVAGGPLFTHETENYPGVHHFVLNEAEITLPLFLADLENGNPKRIYKTEKFADISTMPVPEFHLLNKKAYASMSIQISRGCPFKCEFCEIPIIHGNKVRIKSKEQVIQELDAILQFGWKGTVSIVDDNFIGDKRYVKTELLPAIINWMQNHKYPFVFNVQTSANIADDKELMSLMVQAGIQSTFIGIETLSEESLQTSKKVQNRNRDMLLSVIKIQKAGLLVSGGFIVGFDSDTPEVFKQITGFIQQSGIVWAMVGMLNAPKNTKLYRRLKKENRLTSDMTGNNTDYSLNFIPNMDLNLLMDGYNSIVHDIYSDRSYYKRLRQMMINYQPVNYGKIQIDHYYFMGFIKSIYYLGIRNRGQIEYWKFLFWTIIKKHRLFLHGIMFAICGYHFRKIYGINFIKPRN